MENFNAQLTASTNNTGLDTSYYDAAMAMSSVTAVTVKEAEKAAKKAEREAKKALADAAKAAEKGERARVRAKAKADRDAKKDENKAAKVAARQAAKDKKAADKAAEEAKAKAIAAAVSSVLIQGDAIADKHEAAEKSKVTFQNNSRQVTYDMLVEILAYVEELETRTDFGDILSTMKMHLKKKFKVKVQENTSDLGVIVKYITRTNRKNASMYARVLGEARRHKANSGNLLIYIEQRGGINKIVAGSKVKSTNQKQRVFNAYKRFAEAKLVHQAHAGGMGSIKLTQKQQAMHCDTRDNAGFVYTFGQIKGDELIVIDFVPWVNKPQEMEFLLFKTLCEIKLLKANWGHEMAMEKIKEEMASMFEKFNAYYVKQGWPAINNLGERIDQPNSPWDFNVFDWKLFEDAWTEHLVEKQQQQLALQVQSPTNQ